MDIVTTAIVAALVSGLANVTETAVADAYNLLKSLLVSRYGNSSQLAEAVTMVESNPESEARQEVLREEIETVGAQEDADLTDAAKDLLNVLKTSVTHDDVAYQHIQKIFGNYNAVAGAGGTATVNLSPERD